MDARRVDPRADVPGVFDRGWLPARIEVLRDDGPLRAGDLIEWRPAERAFLCAARGVMVLPWRLRWGWDVLYQAMPSRVRQAELELAVA